MDCAGIGREGFYNSLIKPLSDWGWGYGEEAIELIYKRTKDFSAENLRAIADQLLNNCVRKPVLKDFLEASSKIGAGSVYRNGKLDVPPAKKRWYAEYWGWRRAMGMSLQIQEAEWLESYESNNGRVTHRTKINGDIVPFPA